MQADNEIYAGWYLIMYRITLKFTQDDTVVYTGWFWSYYRGS
jgi:hypothetical protein